MWYAVVIVYDQKFFFVNSWNMYDNIKDMQVDVRQHCGRWGQQAREDQGIRWRQDVSLLLKFFI